MNATLNYDGPAISPNQNTLYNNLEEIVLDERAGYSPSDLVQQKLQRLLPDASIPVSCLHSGREVRRYTT